MTSVCFRHSEKAAKRKCYLCRRVICMACYFRRDHHIFCGRSCFLRWRAAMTVDQARLLAGRSIPVHLFALVLVALLAPIGWLIVEASRELEGGFLRPSVSPVSRTVAARIASIEEGEATMAVVGEATPGSVIFLLRDGEAVMSGSAAPDGSFRLETPLQDKAAVFSVAAVATASLATASFVPSPALSRSPDIDLLIARDSVRSNRARFVESFNRGAADQQQLVLSFDAGSSDNGAREILQTLRAHSIRTTIFLTGEFIERYPAIVREIVADGHEVGNHTWSHPHLTSFAQNRRHSTLPGMTREKFQRELRRTADAFRAATGSEMAPYWRAPFGEENSEIRGWAAELGYLHVGWTRGRRYNLDALDWVVDESSPLYFTPERLAERMLAFDEANGTTLNGGIILMHLGTDRGENERLERALPAMIERFRARGFEFVKVSEMRGGGEHAG